MLLIQYVHNFLSRKLKIPFQVDIAVLMLCVSVRNLEPHITWFQIIFAEAVTI